MSTFYCCRSVCGLERFETELTIACAFTLYWDATPSRTQAIVPNSGSLMKLTRPVDTPKLQLGSGAGCAAIGMPGLLRKVWALRCVGAAGHRPGTAQYELHGLLAIPAQP